ncbi:MAG: DUF1553 domain-containing protein, partial [Planctomycetes bacterium]|nr:DUF1553 domain-containing protein [Planctomycetota bacterium]
WRTSYETLNKLEPPAWHGTVILCAAERDEPATTHVLTRGSPHAPAEEVQPAVPEITQSPSLAMAQASEVYDSESSGRRLALAKWITDPQNQFTSRVMMNRIWQHHFGRAICPTPNDFGHFGEAPTHPELLDWLAAEFRESGWDLQHMIQLMLNSQAYAQSSRLRPEVAAFDPDDRLLSWYPRQRLGAEQIRDQALYVSGLLKERVGGPSVKSYQPDGLWQDLLL